MTVIPAEPKPADLAFKAATAVVEPATTAVIESGPDEGVVTAIVSVTGIEDNVQDIIEPGAYAETLTKRRPKVIWHHNWDHPIGRILHIEELSPGDSRLPQQTKDGKAWPKAAGGLLATMQFNLKSERGREAFEAVKFYSETGECEWSIGYQVPSSKSTRDKQGVRHIKAIDLFEISYVLFGAASETGTLGLKAAVEAARLRMEFKGSGGHLPPADDGRVADAVIRRMSSPMLKALTADGWTGWWATAALAADAEDGGEVKRDYSAAERRKAPTMPGSDAYPINNLTDLDNAIQSWGRSKPADRAKLKRWLLKRARELNASQDVVDRINGLNAGGTKDAAPQRPEATTTPSSPAPTTPTPGPEGPVGDPSTTDPSVPDGGDEGGEGGDPSATPPVDPPQREVGPSPTPQEDDEMDDDAAMAYAIASHAEEIDPDDWAAWADELDDEDRALADLFAADADGGVQPPEPGSKTSGGSTRMTVTGPALTFTGNTNGSGAKAITPGGRVGDDSPVGTEGGQQNWVDKVGGLPRYIRMIAHALIRRGMSKSRAIATAVATVKRWASGVGNVSAKVRAAAAKAVAEWEAKKTASHAAKAMSWDPWAERGEFAAVKMAYPTSHSEFPRLEGTFEERMNAVSRAVCEALQEAYEQSGDGGGPTDGGGIAGRSERYYISVDGTFPDRVIATRVEPDTGERESFEMNYVIAPDGEVTLSEPEPVTLTVYVEDGPPEDGSTEPDIPMGDLLNVPETVEGAVGAAKALLAVANTGETKTGRVLSGVNEARLKAALESLIATLRSAGIDIEAGKPGEVKPPDLDTTTTAKAHQVPVADIEATLARLRG